MLTYETLRKIVQEERASNSLTRLPEDFFEAVKVYLEKKAKISESKDDVWELESARRTLQDLLEIRDRKIVTAALYFERSGVVPDNITPEEKEFFDAFVKNIKEFKTMRKNILEGKPEKKELVAVLDDVPRFVGVNMKEYGPFRKGDVVTLPEENAKLLLEKKQARKIEY